MAVSSNEIPMLPKNVRLVVRVEPIAVRVEEAAKMLGVSRTKVYDLVAREDFDGAFKLGGCTLISVEALKNWVRGQLKKRGGG